jgi:hypothetical protein
VILCPSCKSTLDPTPGQDYGYEDEPEPGSFRDGYEFDRFIRDHC